MYIYVYVCVCVCSCSCLFFATPLNRFPIRRDVYSPFYFVEILTPPSDPRINATLLVNETTVRRLHVYFVVPSAFLYHGL